MSEQEEGFRYVPGMSYESITTMRNRIIEDALPPAWLQSPGVAEKMRYVPPSPEVAEDLQRRQKARAEAVAELAPVVNALSLLSAETIESAILIVGGPEFSTEQRRLMMTIPITVLSSLFDMGLIERP